MKVVERYGIESAAACEGVVVVIDVLRAFTTAAYAFAAGAESIVLVKDVEEAFALKRKAPELLLAGEVDGRPIPGFDFDNSPAAIARADLQGRRFVLRSSSGTQGVVGAARAERLLLGSLVVARATADHLRKQAPPLVTLLAMGSTRALDREEDLACSNYLAALLSPSSRSREEGRGRGAVLSAQEAARRVRESPAGKNALDPKVDWISPEDLDCAVAVDRFPFAMAVTREDGLLVARKQTA